VTPEIIPFLGVRHPVASGTHFVAFLLALIGTYMLWRRAEGQPRVQFAATCFGLSMLLLYIASAIYHSLQIPWEQLRYLQLVDWSAIYILIAGTYTPVLLLLPDGWRRGAFFAAIWLMAAVGIAFKTLAFAGFSRTNRIGSARFCIWAWAGWG
jgi:hemolysin III